MYVTYKYVLVLSFGHFLQIQGHWKEKCKFVVSQNLCFGETLKVHTSNKDSLTPEGFSRYWPRSFGKVQGQWNEKCKIYVQSITKFFFMENHWKSSPCKEIAFELEVVPLCRVCLKTVEVSRSHTDEGSDEIDFYLLYMDLKSPVYITIRWKEKSQ